MRIKSSQKISSASFYEEMYFGVSFPRKDNLGVRNNPLFSHLVRFSF